MYKINIPDRPGIQLRENAELASVNKIPKRVYIDGELVEVATKKGTHVEKNGFMLVKGHKDGDEYGYIQTKYLLPERASAAGHSMGAAAAPPPSYTAPPPSYMHVYENVRDGTGRYPLYDPSIHQARAAPPPPYAPPPSTKSLEEMGAGVYIAPLEPGGMPVVQMRLRDEFGRQYTIGPGGERNYIGGTRRRKYKGKGRDSKGKSKTARKSRRKSRNRNRRTKSKSRN